MNIHKNLTAFCLTLLAVYCGCNGEPLLTELKTSRIKVIVKGTYESNSPKNWAWPAGGIADLADDSVSIYPVKSSNPIPDVFMLDITGMKLVSDNKTSNFGNYRKTYSCSTADDNAPFFNGAGITMHNDDTDRDKLYTKVDFYIRKILFSNTPQYELRETGWADNGYFKTYFEERKTKAFNFNLLLVNYLYDNFRYENDGDDTNRVYPIHIDISNGLVFTGKENLVLEVRFVIKNFVKLYEYNRLDYTSDEPYIIHYFGVSDWLRDVKAGENTIGGNLLAVARTYVEGKTGNASGTIGAAGYVIGIPADADINDYTMPNLAGKNSLRAAKLRYADAPSEPLSASDNMPAILMYYTQLEHYKIKWNEFLNSVKTNYGANDYTVLDPSLSFPNPQALFEYEWTKYNDAANNFKIAPLAVYTADGNFNIENIAPGDYKFYYTNTIPAWGALFENNCFNPLKDSGTGSAVVTVEANQSTILAL